MLLSVIMTIVISLPIVPRVDDALAGMSKKALAYYPPDLVVTVVGGQVSVNKPEPYALPIPLLLRDAANQSGITSLITIDTMHEVSLEQFLSYHSVFWLTKGGIVGGDTVNGLRTLEFPPEMNITVEEGSVKQALGQLESLTPFIAPTIVLLLFLAFLFSFVILLLYLVIDALFILLIGRILNYDWTYGASYRIGLHAVTLPILFSSAISLVPLGNVSLPFLTALLSLVIVYMNFKDRVLPNAAPMRSEVDADS